MNDLSIYAKTVDSLAATNWLSESDQGQVTLLLKLSLLLDHVLSSPDLIKDAPNLIARYSSIADSLKLTPKSRETTTGTTLESVDHGAKFYQDYLRVTDPASRNDAKPKPKPRTASKRTSAKPRDPVNALAGVRPKPSASTK